MRYGIAFNRLRPIGLPLAAGAGSEVPMVLPQGTLGRVIGGTLREVPPLDALDEVGDHALVVEALPGGEHVGHARVRLGATRHEERAAVRRGLARDVVRPDLVGSSDNLLLVGADQRAQDGHRHRLVDGSDVLERLRGNLAERLARNQRLRALEKREAKGNREDLRCLMKDIEINRNVTRPVKCLIIAMLSLMFLVTLIPLWQVGARSNAAAFPKASAEAIDAEKEGKALMAAVAAGLPEDEGEFLMTASI